MVTAKQCKGGEVKKKVRVESRKEPAKVEDRQWMGERRGKTCEIMAKRGGCGNEKSLIGKRGETVRQVRKE